MKRDLVDLLACPRDAAFPLALAEENSTAEEVVAGTLTCPECGIAYSIETGIPDLCELGDESEERRLKETEIAARAEIEQGDHESHYTAYETAADARAVLGALNLRAGSAVLELGCGDGRISKSLLVSCDRFVGVDYSVEFLRRFQAKAGDGTTPDLIRADVNQLPLRSDGDFDSVLSSFMYCQLPSPALRRQFLEHSAALLRPGGRFVLTTYNYGPSQAAQGLEKEGRYPSGIYFYRHTPEELRSELAEYFEVISIRGVRNRLVPRRILERVGRWGGAIDAMISRFPISRRVGFMLVAACVRSRSAA